MSTPTKPAIASKTIWSLVIAILIKVIGVLADNGILPPIFVDIFNVISEDILAGIAVLFGITFRLGSDTAIKGLTKKR